MTQDADGKPKTGHFWQPIAIFLLGVVFSGTAMVVRGDFLGAQAAEDAETRLNAEINRVETRLNTRVDRELAAIRESLREIKASLVRLEDRKASP